jgi:arylsulfatase A-like enzyme
VYLEHRWQDELRVRLAERLAPRKVDLLAVYLRLIDAASHQFLRFERPAELEACRAEGCDTRRLAAMVLDSYEIFDAQLGRLMRAMPPDTVWLIVSDHGQISIDGQAGVHQNNGLLVLSGPGIRPGTLYEAQVTDVAPTVLYLLDVAVGSDMTGRILTPALETSLLEARPPRHVLTHETLGRPLPRAAHELDQKLADEHLEALEALGYMQ